jgi:hypothetical protein
MTTTTTATIPAAREGGRPWLMLVVLLIGQFMALLDGMCCS